MENYGNPPPADMKLFPRNLTARADYVVRGNPVVSRPESGADNCHPGLEFDQRNLDRHFFPGLVFDFQFGAGARLADVRSPWSEKTEQDGRRCLDAKEGDFFLWYIYGVFGDQPTERQLVNLYGLDGYDVLRKVHDLEAFHPEARPQPLIIAIGRRPEELGINDAARWLEASKELLAQLLAPQMGALGEQIKTFRDADGKLQFAILVGRRARYLDEQGVIDIDALKPGALTQSLCSPWQWDFADCGCFYWAASRPDIVTSADGKREGLNFLRLDRQEAPRSDLALTWQSWMDPARTMLAPHLILGWESLPVVINDREATSYQQKTSPDLLSPWNREQVIVWLRYLASVEHALSVKFLYAHYSVNAPPIAGHGPIETTDSPMTMVAKEIFNVAIDEMRHFRWVNEALKLLGEDAVFARAAELVRPTTKGLQKTADLALEALTPDELAHFVEIERPSQQEYKKDEEIAGLYTHVLVSLDRHDKRLVEYTANERERLQEICKLIIDEGADHWRRAVRVQELLKDRDHNKYLRFTGPPERQATNPDCDRLRQLGDQYYHLMLGVLRLAFDQPPEVRGRTIRQARRVMHNLHEIGHLLGERGCGLLFTLPPEPDPGSAPGGGVGLALTTSIPDLLEPLRALGSTDVAAVAKRHAQSIADLQRALASHDDEEDGA
jgi:rubrerythrin